MTSDSEDVARVRLVVADAVALAVALDEEEAAARRISVGMELFIVIDCRLDIRMCMYVGTFYHL